MPKLANNALEQSQKIVIAQEILLLLQVDHNSDNPIKKLDLLAESVQCLKNLACYRGKEPDKLLTSKRLIELIQQSLMVPRLVNQKVNHSIYALFRLIILAQVNCKHIQQTLRWPHAHNFHHPGEEDDCGCLRLLLIVQKHFIYELIAGGGFIGHVAQLLVLSGLYLDEATEHIFEQCCVSRMLEQVKEWLLCLLRFLSWQRSWLFAVQLSELGQQIVPVHIGQPRVLAEDRDNIHQLADHIEHLAFADHGRQLLPQSLQDDVHDLGKLLQRYQRRLSIHHNIQEK